MSKFVLMPGRIIAAGCGAAYSYVPSILFGRVLVSNPINLFLLEKLAKTGREFEYYLAIYALDFLLYVIVALPIAFAISRLPPKGNWSNLLIALAVSLAMHYWVPIVDLSSFVSLARHWQFYVELGFSVLALPLAFAVARALQRHSNSPAPHFDTHL